MAEPSRGEIGLQPHLASVEQTERRCGGGAAAAATRGPPPPQRCGDAEPLRCADAACYDAVVDACVGQFLCLALPLPDKPRLYC